MKRLALRLSIGILAFIIGVLARTVYFFNTSSASNLLEAAISAHLNSPSFINLTCFPGLSVRVRYMGIVRYFPNQSGSFNSEWYSKHLDAMREPNLYMGDSGQNQSYRFLWLRTFHHPIAVRLWRSGGQQFIRAKQLSGAGGYEPGRLISDKTLTLSTQDWDTFVRLIEQARYWKLPTEDTAMGFDGAHWILEGVRENRYHLVDRWSPTGGDFREACLYLLKVSGLINELSSKDVY